MSFPPIRIGSLSCDWSRTYILGIVNVTPDSFSDGGRFASTELAAGHAVALGESGADLLDIGGESTRPGAKTVSAAEEMRRVLPVIAALRGLPSFEKPISVDTIKAEVAEAALRAGAAVVNDISGGALDPDVLRVAARHQAVLILGHLRGQPATMQQDVHFRDVVLEVAEELRQRVERAVACGVPRERILIDPGIGFGKTAVQSYELVSGIGKIREMVNRPVCVGPSRKSFLAAVTGSAPADRLMETAAAVAASIVLGAHMVRLHDAKELLPVVRVADAVRHGLRT